ncbi:aminoacyl-tRNA hydrolase [Dialister pneumosintes]|uniref:Peptidyl-tRNA hydrolase n=1 Tax=Dialister pneumosintes TaxID=39950 RepID=A0A1B3WD84_9FIRM|nr:aminoacyl-tRNA hydrolase [Dialister pneumosintes]AOH38900.1 aminoacyl-tRNA hydrolase [Dialister pneumosintes]
MKLIVGLGNPGKEYVATRHNVGFDVIDELATRWKISAWKKDFSAEIAMITINEEKVCLMKPLTYMNKSGDAINTAVRFYKICADDIWVICDDLDLPVGKIRIRKKGSAGGHNGLKSIISHMGQDFPRFRIGVGHPKDGHTVIEHVLGRPYGADIVAVNKAIKYTADAVIGALDKGIDKAMNAFNPKRG